MPDVNAKFSFIKNLILRVDLVYILMILVSLILLSFRFRRRFKLTRKELSGQREKNKISEVSYQDDHEINKLLRELNKTLSWSQNAILENQLHRNRLEDILDSIMIGVLAFTHRGQIIFMNDAFRKIFRIESQNIENQEIYKWIHFPPVISDIDNFLRDITLPEINNTIKFYDDSFIEYRIFRQKSREDADQIYLISVRDVTRLRQLETVRRDFITNASHEFKTPLSTIKGFTETLLSGTVDSKDLQIKFLKKIERQTKHLENLVSDILQLAKIEKKNISDMIRINVKSMIEELVEEFIPLVKQSGLSIEFDSFSEDSESQIEANPDTIRIIIANLLINAIQYNKPKGKIKIRLRQQSNFCVFEIEDTGIGISKKDVNRIFERFFRTNDARSIYAEGTGLGLSIVKMFVEMLGGEIWVESEPARGTTFSFTLPLTTTELPEPVPDLLSTELSAGIARRQKILVVEDDRDLALLLRRQLESEGFQVLLAGTGEDALWLAREAQPQLITLDIMLPDVDGFAVLEKLKANPMTRGIPVVIVSVLAESEKGFALGAVDYVVKPFVEQELLDIVHRALAYLETSRPRKLVVADDDLEALGRMEQALSLHGYEVWTAADGQEALDRAQEIQPDLILLDVGMPLMDGYEVVRKLKKDDRTRPIPVIVATDSPADREQERVRVLGMDIAEYLTKPLSIEILIREIKKVIAEKVSG